MKNSIGIYLFNFFDQKARQFCKTDKALTLAYLKRAVELLVLENFIFLMFNQILFLKLPNVFPVFNLGPREIYFIKELLLDEHSSLFKPTVQKDTILVSILFFNLNVHDAFLIVLNIGTICKKFSLLIQRILGYH